MPQPVRKATPPCILEREAVAHHHRGNLKQGLSTPAASATSTNCPSDCSETAGQRSMRTGKTREQQHPLRQQRRQRAAELVRIRLTHKQIAERLGVAASTVAELLAEGSEAGIEAALHRRRNLANRLEACNRAPSQVDVPLQ